MDTTCIPGLVMKAGRDWPRARSSHSASDSLTSHCTASGKQKSCRSSHSLIWYSWELASCVPMGILSPNGFLPMTQSSLTRLSLINGTDCNLRCEKEYKYDLDKFDSLRDLSWLGPQTPSDFVALRKCLTTNASHMNSLSLDLRNWRDYSSIFRERSGTPEETAEEADALIRDILSITDDKDLIGAKSRFPMLTSLSLSQTPLGGNDTDRTKLLRALSFSHLKTLKLRNCDKMAPMIKFLASESICSQLTNIEIFAFDVEDSNALHKVKVKPLLDSLSELEDVFLFLDEENWDSIADSISGHASSLKRVVLHRREIFMDDNYQWEQEETRTFTETLPILQADGFRKLFVESDCEMIGITCDLDDLASST